VYRNYVRGIDYYCYWVVGVIVFQLHNVIFPNLHKLLSILYQRQDFYQTVSYKKQNSLPFESTCVHPRFFLWEIVLLFFLILCVVLMLLLLLCVVVVNDVVIVNVFFIVFVLCLVWPMLPVSLYCQFLIAHSIFSIA